MTESFKIKRAELSIGLCSVLGNLMFNYMDDPGKVQGKAFLVCFVNTSSDRVFIECSCLVEFKLCLSVLVLYLNHAVFILFSIIL